MLVFFFTALQRKTLATLSRIVQLLESSQAVAAGPTHDSAQINAPAVVPPLLTRFKDQTKFQLSDLRMNEADLAGKFHVKPISVNESNLMALSIAKTNGPDRIRSVEYCNIEFRHTHSALQIFSRY